MGRGGKFVFRGNKKRGVRSKEKGSDDSDEDYVFEEDEEFDNSGEYCASDGDASEEVFDSGLNSISYEEDEEEVRKVVRSKRPKGSSGRRKTMVEQPQRRTRVPNYDEEEEDDDDDQDEDFTLDGIDCEDEEEELQVKEKSKVTKGLSRTKVSVKSRKRKRKSKVSKKPVRKKQKRGSVVRRPASSDDEFIVANRVVREKSRKKSGRRKKKLVVHSDSDFVSSGSTDFEYTISEEEREQVREASKLCGILTTCSSNSSTLNRLQVDGALSRQQRKLPGRKGKEKVEDLQYDVGKQVCGICFSDEGSGTIRGNLNCCSHYFCFACIMEWSKIESRCPCCKQRFMTISQPARLDVGIDLRNVVIKVPKRDQVYRPSEEEVRGYLDPYENVLCIECQQGGDDNLMLLCDICDSPAHTYCVGLAREVPEGNWYCEGCRPSSHRSSNPQVQDSLPYQGSSNSNLPSEQSTGEVNAEGLQPTPQYSVSVPDQSFSQGIGNLPSPRYQLGDRQAAASTLSGRRRIHRQVHNLLSSNRMSQMVWRRDGVSISEANLVSDSMNSEIEQNVEVTHQHTRTSENGWYCSAGVESRAQDSTSSPVQYRGPFSASLSHLRRQSIQSPNTASANGSVHGMLYADPAGINPIMGYEQLHHYSSSPVARSDANISPHT